MFVKNICAYLPKVRFSIFHTIFMLFINYDYKLHLYIKQQNNVMFSKYLSDYLLLFSVMSFFLRSKKWDRSPEWNQWLTNFLVNSQPVSLLMLRCTKMQWIPYIAVVADVTILTYWVEMRPYVTHRLDKVRKRSCSLILST